MDIIQIDSKTIKIEKHGIAFHLLYHFSWDDIVRHPESITLDNNRVSAFFPTSVIKDTISEYEKGFSIKRVWHIVPAGNISLFFTLDMLHYINVPFLFPCMYEGQRIGSKKIMVMGERLSYPSSVYLFPEKMSIFIAGSYPEREDEQGSIGLEMAYTDSGKKLRTEICFPPCELLPQSLLSKNGYIQGSENNSYTSQGNLKKQITFHVLIEQGGRIYPLAVSHAQKYYRGQKSQKPKKPFLTKREAIKMIKDGITQCMETLLVDSQGIFGPLLSEKNKLISLPTTAGLAFLVQQIYDNDPSMHETSLRFADFVLKGQHPNGIFFEYYNCERKRWETYSSLKEKSNTISRSYIQPPVTRLSQSAETTDYLLRLSMMLRNKGFFGNKYFMAARKFLELFFDQKGRLIDISSVIVMDSLQAKEHSLSCLELISPLITLFKNSDKDKYRKAVKKIKDDFFIETFPYQRLLSMKEGQLPDFNTALLLLRTAIAFEKMGFSLRSMETFIHVILPWIYFNRSEAPPHFGEVRGIIDSYKECRIIFRGFELSYYLIKVLDFIDKKSLIRLLTSLIEELIDFSRDIPIGTPWFQHSLWNSNGNDKKNPRGVVGSFNSEVFVREAHFLLKIVNESAYFLK